MYNRKKGKTERNDQENLNNTEFLQMDDKYQSLPVRENVVETVSTRGNHDIFSF